MIDCDSVQGANERQVTITGSLDNRVRLHDPPMFRFFVLGPSREALVVVGPSRDAQVVVGLLVHIHTHARSQATHCATNACLA